MSGDEAAQPMRTGKTMSQADFEAPFLALNEHLKEVRPIFDAFCGLHGFVYVNRQALGRYPRIRIERIGAATIWFDLWMELDQEGKRFERFKRDLPYELAAGAEIVVPGETEYGTRFSVCFACFSGKAFDEVRAALPIEMERHLPTLEKWDAQYLLENGQKLRLGA